MVYSVGKAIRQLNKKIDNIYFLSGDDYFLQKFFINNLNKKFNFDSSPRYFNFEEEKDINVFLQEISGISLFSKKDIYIIRNLSRIPKNSKDEILTYLNSPKDDLITVFVSNDFYSKNKFFHSISSKAKTVDTRTPFPNKIKEWVRYYLKINKISIDYSFLDEIIYSNKDEIMTILGEIEKIYLANGCNKITYDNTSEIIKVDKNIRPWHLLDTLGKKDCKKSIEHFESLQLGGYTIVLLIINLYNFFNTMSLYNINPKSNIYGLNKIVSSNLPIYIRNYKEHEIMNIIVELKNLDIIVKTTSLNSENLMSILITKICQDYYG
ncbi:MAG: DNA polymerase III subunit delta [Candidatus Marinimicrobia bacterium]|nr:DNA polymerase III subunit delta [Candidatus Neomarinimicrobiota bacterium]|tara:strand:+ start:2554 stop:3522 length:969 start_codon:yes stop_codon:yes gene_type:complete